MTNKPTIGMRLLTLKERSGMSLSAIASGAGYRASSSIQKLFRPDYDPERLQLGVAERLASAFAGKGDPEIQPLELVALAGEGNQLQQIYAELSHYTYKASAFIGIHRTKRVDEYVDRDDGQKLQLFVREVIDDGIPYHPCPPYLRSRGIVGLYVAVGNMWPRFEEGEPIFYEHHKPPSQGDDVIVTVESDNLNGAMFIGRLRLSNEKEAQIEQLAPAGIIVLPRREIISMRRIMHATDLLGPVSYASIP